MTHPTFHTSQMVVAGPVGPPFGQDPQEERQWSVLPRRPEEGRSKGAACFSPMMGREPMRKKGTGEEYKRRSPRRGCFVVLLELPVVLR